MSEHADAIHAAIESGDATSALIASWRRAKSVHGLAPETVRLPERDPEAFRDGLERDAALIAAARPYLNQIYAALDERDALACVTDASGLLLAQRTGRIEDSWRRGADEALGSFYTEENIGTCAIGTSLAEERPVMIAGGQHFLDRLAWLTGFGAPIHGPDGTIAGCLGVVVRAREGAGTRDSFVLLTVSGFARRIGLDLFAAAFPRTKLMLASRDPNLSSAVLAVSDDERVIGATRAARRVLGLSNERMAESFSVRELFGAPQVRELAKSEAILIGQAMARYGNNRSLVAKALGISRSTLYRKLMEPTRAKGPIGDC